jgi:hypothetical protein
MGLILRPRAQQAGSTPQPPYTLPHAPARCGPTTENTMAKGQQRSNKEVKKPKVDKSPAKPISPQAVKPAITTVVADRHKKK